MRTVTTVSGDISPDDLGFCQSHEHVCITRGRSAEINPDLLIDDETKSAEELRVYFSKGGRAIVDAQPIGCGRDARFLENVSRVSGVHIVASTGFHRMIFYPDDHWIWGAPEDALAQIFISELTDGMYVNCDEAPPREKTTARAGQIKTALDTKAAQELDAQYKKLFRAAAQAAKTTGRALMAHIERGSNPIALAEFLQTEGVPPAKIIFCHMDRAADDLGIHREICSMGIFLEYDTICRPKYHDDGREAEITASMTSAGFEDNILMGLDTTRARLRAYGGAPGLNYILEEFIPFLETRGVTQGQVRKFFVDNPARAFAWG